MITEKWNQIKCLDVTNLLQNREQLNYLENELIELYETERNKDKPPFKQIDKLRALSLISTIHNLNQNWKTHTNRKEYQDKKIYLSDQT